MSAIEDAFSKDSEDVTDEFRDDTTQDESAVEERPVKKKRDVKKLAIIGVSAVAFSGFLLFKLGIIGGSKPPAPPVMPDQAMMDPTAQQPAPQAMVPDAGQQQMPPGMMPAPGAQPAVAPDMGQAPIGQAPMGQPPMGQVQMPPQAPSAMPVGAPAMEPQLAQAPQSPAVQAPHQEASGEVAAAMNAVRTDIREMRGDIQNIHSRLSQVEQGAGVQTQKPKRQKLTEAPSDSKPSKPSKAKPKKAEAQEEIAIRVENDEKPVSVAVEYSVYAIKDGRAWLKDKAGNTLTVVAGGSIGGAKVKSIDDVTGVVATTAGVIH